MADMVIIVTYCNHSNPIDINHNDMFMFEDNYQPEFDPIFGKTTRNGGSTGWRWNIIIPTSGHIQKSIHPKKSTLW